MARSPRFAAEKRLESATLNLRRAQKAVQSAREQLRTEAVKAVTVGGLSRYEVAKITGLSKATISNVPGMPPGKNARTSTSED